MAMIELSKSKGVDVTLANSFWKRFTGLMLKKDIADNQIMCFYPCDGIHTMFMRFNIDVVYLDGSMNVIGIEKNIGPWSILRPCRGAVYTLEMKPGLWVFELGDKVNWEE